MSDDLVKRLRSCSSDEAMWSIEAANHIEKLEARLAKAVGALNGMVKECEEELLPSHGYIKYFCRKTLAELKGERG